MAKIGHQDIIDSKESVYTIAGWTAPFLGSWRFWSIIDIQNTLIDIHRIRPKRFQSSAPLWVGMTAKAYR